MERSPIMLKIPNPGASASTMKTNSRLKKSARDGIKPIGMNVSGKPRLVCTLRAVPR